MVLGKIWGCHKTKKYYYHLQCKCGHQFIAPIEPPYLAMDMDTIFECPECNHKDRIRTCLN